MKHFVYAIDFDAPAPAGGLASEDWFRDYKWMVEGELFLPIFKEDEQLAAQVVAGDRLWIVVQGGPHGMIWDVFGHVTVLRLDPPSLSSHTQCGELRYNGESCVEVPAPYLLHTHDRYNHLRLTISPEEFYLDRWLNFLKNTT